MKLVKRIDICCMNDGGWNAAVPGGPWATDTTPQRALAHLLSSIAKSQNWKLATDNREGYDNDSTRAS